MKINQLNKILSLVLIFLLLSTFASPVAASWWNPYSWSKEDAFCQAEDGRPAILVMGDDGVQYVVVSDDCTRPSYFDWVKEDSVYKVVDGKYGEKLLLFYLPGDYHHKNNQVWSLPGVNAIAPAVVPAGVAIVAYFGKDVALLTTGTILAGGVVYEINILPVQYKHFMDNFVKWGQGAMEFCQENINTLTHMLTAQYYRLDGKYKQRSEITFGDALELMKKCDDSNKDKTKITKEEKNEKYVWLGSTEEGCKKLAELATKQLGGKEPVFNSGKGQQPPHYHAGSAKHKHCKAHCFWDFEDFTKREQKDDF